MVEPVLTVDEIRSESANMIDRADVTAAGPAPEDRPARNTVFAAPAEDPRARRPVDGFVLGICVLLALLAGWTHDAPSDFDQRALELFSGRLPGWLSAILTFGFVLGGVYSIGLLVAILVFGNGRRAVARDMVLAVLAAFCLAVAVSWAISGEWPQLLPELAGRDRRPAYPVVRLAVAFALLTVASPYLSLPMRTIGRRLLATMVVAAVVLGYGTVSAVVGGVAIGIGAASLVRLIFGSGVGIPSKARIAQTLEECGIDAGVELTYLDRQPVGHTLLRADDDGRTWLVKVFGRDAADAAIATRLWRAMWFTDLDNSITASGLQQVEHESLMLLEGARQELAVPQLVGWGRGDAGDAIVVTSWLDAPRLADLDSVDVDDAALASCWELLDDFHGAGIAHRKLDANLVLVSPTSAAFDDLSGSVIAPSASVRAADIAQLVVATAVSVGPQRAIDAARAGLDDDRLAEALPLVQRTALSSTLQGQAKAADLDLKQFRADLAEAIGVESPEPAQLARVTWGTVGMLVLAFFAFSALIGTLADIGFETIVDELSTASLSWVVTAFVLAQMTNVGEWVSLTGLVQRPVPFGPTILFRYSLSFVSLAVPSEAGAIAMNIRYMRKLGVPAANAIAQGPFLTVVSKGLDIILLLLASRVVGASITLDDFDPGPILNVVLLVVVLAVAGIVVTLVVPSIRNRIVPPIREAFSSISSSLRDPRRLVRIVGGSLASRLLFAMTLSASVSAYGNSISFTEAVFVNSAVSLLVGFMPVPGGIGVGEAALTAGLTLVGVPEGAAFAAALTHRLVTTYLPPVAGFFTTRWLTARDYL